MALKGVSWLAGEFKGTELGDKRLEERCQKVARTLGRRPAKSIPEACGDWGSAQGVYRFLSNEDVSREAFLAPQRESTMRRCRQAAEVVALQDTMSVNLTHHPATEGLGPLGTAKGLEGLVAHHTLAVEWGPGKVLGVLHQEVWVRDGRRPAKETAQQRRQRARESESGTRGLEALRASGLESAIYVADRGSDIDEALKALEENKQRYVIRAPWNRRLAGRETEYIVEAVARSPVIGTISVSLRGRPGQKARTALLSVRESEVTIRPPVALGRHGKDLVLSVVQASEEQAPKGSPPLKGVLLTQEPTDTVEACARVVTLYSRRWKIEGFHKGLKSGCGIEDRQWETREGMGPFLGLATVMSVLWLRLRDAARGEEAARFYLTDVQIKCLQSQYPSLASDPTAREALRTLARLGGSLARKGDGEPGWQTLWRGMEKLLLIEHGSLFAQK